MKLTHPNIQSVQYTQLVIPRWRFESKTSRQAFMMLTKLHYFPPTFTSMLGQQYAEMLGGVKSSTSHITFQYVHMLNKKLIFPKIILTLHTLLWLKPSPI